jgi:HEAT repeat protein
MKRHRKRRRTELFLKKPPRARRPPSKRTPVRFGTRTLLVLTAFGVLLFGALAFTRFKKPPDRQMVAQASGHVGPQRPVPVAVPARPSALREDRVPQTQEKAAEAVVARIVKQHTRTANALAEIGPAAQSTVPALITATRDKNPWVRGAAIKALAQIAIGPKVPDDVATAVAAALADPEEHVKACGIDAFSSLARHDTHFALAMVNRDDTPVRRAALSALAFDARLATDAWPALVTALENPDPETRATAALAISSAAQASGRPVPKELIRNLNDEDINVRRQTALALGAFGAEAEGLVPLLDDAMRDRDPVLRSLAGRAKDAVVAAYADIQGIVKRNTERLSSTDIDIRLYGIEALAKLGPRAAPALPELMHLLREEAPAVRRAAALALGQMGPAALPARENLAEMAVTDPDPYVRIAAEAADQTLGAFQQSDKA